MIVQFEGRSVNFADIIIPGAAKSGTTSLAYYLYQHPDIHMPRKEPGFFYFYNRNDLWKYKSDVKQIITVDDYIQFYKKVRPGQKILDASTKYLYTYNETIANIKKFYDKRISDLKLIIILRNPIERAFSHFLYYKKIGVEPYSFEKAIQSNVLKKRTSYYNYLEYGLYYKQVKKYLGEFSQIKIYLYEDLSEIQKLLNEIFDFVDIDPGPKIDTTVRSNPSGIPISQAAMRILNPDKGFGKGLKKIVPFSLHPKFAKMRYSILEKLLYHPEFPESQRRNLVNYFKDDILSLQELINRDLGHWIAI